MGVSEKRQHFHFGVEYPFKDLTSKYDYQQMINGPTRISRKTQTLIDLVFMNKPERIIKAYNLVCGLSDHNM